MNTKKMSILQRSLAPPCSIVSTQLHLFLVGLNSKFPFNSYKTHACRFNPPEWVLNIINKYHIIMNTFSLGGSSFYCNVTCVKKLGNYLYHLLFLLKFEKSIVWIKISSNCYCTVFCIFIKILNLTFTAILYFFTNLSDCLHNYL